MDETSKKNLDTLLGKAKKSMDWKEKAKKEIEMKTPMQEMLEWVRSTFPMGLETPRLIEKKVESLLVKERYIFEDIIDIIDSENSGLSAEQRLDEIKELIKNL